MIPPKEREAFQFFVTQARQQGRPLVDVLDEAGVLLTTRRQEVIEKRVHSRILWQFAREMGQVDANDQTTLRVLRKVREWLETVTW